MSKSIEGINGRTGIILDWVRWVATVLVIPAMAVIASFVVRHERRQDADVETIRMALRAVVTAQAVMEGNRFTSEDGVKVWRELTELRALLLTKADAQGAQPVLSSLDDLKARVRDLERERRK